jgi:hypothetical protein
LRSLELLDAVLQFTDVVRVDLFVRTEFGNLNISWTIYAHD